MIDLSWPNQPQIAGQPSKTFYHPDSKTLCFFNSKLFLLNFMKNCPQSFDYVVVDPGILMSSSNCYQALFELFKAFNLSGFLLSHQDELFYQILSSYSHVGRISVRCSEIVSSFVNHHFRSRNSRVEDQPSNGLFHWIMASRILPMVENIWKKHDADPNKEMVPWRFKEQEIQDYFFDSIHIVQTPAAKH